MPMGMQARALRLDMEDLGKSKLPESVTHGVWVKQWQEEVMRELTVNEVELVDGGALLAVIGICLGMLGICSFDGRVLRRGQCEEK